MIKTGHFSEICFMPKTSTSAFVHVIIEIIIFMIINSDEKE